MKTFSQVVDQVMQASGRVWQASTIVDYVQQAINDMHYDDDGMLILYPDNLVEDQLTATTETGFQWTRPARWQKMQTASYPMMRHSDGTHVYPKYLRPGRVMAQYNAYYYQSGPYYVFCGYGGTNALINVAYYQSPGLLKYYEQAKAPAYYDETDTLVYQDQTANGDLDYTLAANQAAAVAKTTNWILDLGYSAVYWGALNALYMTVKDPERASMSFSKFSKLRKGFIKTHGGVPAA